MSLTSFTIVTCKTQALHFGGGCGLSDQSSVVAIGLQLIIAIEYHWTWHMNLFGVKEKVFDKFHISC